MFPLSPRECGEFPELFPTGLIPCSPEDNVPKARLYLKLFGLMLLLNLCCNSAGEYGGTGDPERSLPVGTRAASASLAGVLLCPISAGLRESLRVDELLCPDRSW